MTTPPFPPVREADLAVLRAQLGRPPRGVVGIAARCVCGNPTVAATSPRLPDGTPFPTFYYLTHPAATAAMSALEANHVMRDFADDLEADAALRAAYAGAHEAYLRDRARYGEVARIAGISAGGMPTRVKCLHALAAHALAAGPGVNPVGDAAIARSEWSPTRCVCAAPGAAVAESAPGVAESAPGVAESAPGVAESAPGFAESAPGDAESAPGVAESARGVAESAPGVAESAPGVPVEPNVPGQG